MIELTPSHEYFVDGVRYPGFSEIAAATGLIRPYTGDPWYGERGTAVHAATELIDRGELDGTSVDTAISGFLDAYLLFKEESRMEFEHVEEPLAHSVYKYAGCPDRWLPLVDIKTTASSFDLQLAAYGELIRDQGIAPGREAFFLHLREDGSYKLTQYRFNRRDTNIWLAAVTLFHYRQGKGLL